PERFELPTTWFVARYSIQLSYGRGAWRHGGGSCPPWCVEASHRGADSITCPRRTKPARTGPYGRSQGKRPSPVGGHGNGSWPSSSGSFPSSCRRLTRPSTYSLSSTIRPSLTSPTATVPATVRLPEALWVVANWYSAEKRSPSTRIRCTYTRVSLKFSFQKRNTRRAPSASVRAPGKAKTSSG